MARRYDPRYDVNQGYAAGDAMVKLSQLLRQGVGDYRQAGLDEENSQQKQANYLLQLQQMLGAQEDRDLNRGLAYDELGRRTAADQKTAADRASAAATTASGRSGRLKILQLLGGGGGLPADITADEAGQPDIFTGLMKHYEGLRPKEPKAPEDFTLGEGQTRFDPTGQPKASVAKVEKPKDAKPFFEGKTPTELDIILADPSTPPEQKAIAQAALKSIRDADLTKSREQGSIAAGNQVNLARERQTIEATGPQKETAEERQKAAERTEAATLGRGLIEQLEQHPDFAGGPFGVKGRVQSFKLRLGNAPEGFAEFSSKLQRLAGTYSRSVAGAALTPTEEKRYLSYVPDLKRDSDQEIAAKLQLMVQSAEELQRLTDTRRGVGSSAPPGFTPRTR